MIQPSAPLAVCRVLTGFESGLAKGQRLTDSEMNVTFSVAKNHKKCNYSITCYIVMQMDHIGLNPQYLLASCGDICT